MICFSPLKKDERFWNTRRYNGCSPVHARAEVWNHRHDRKSNELEAGESVNWSAISYSHQSVKLKLKTHTGLYGSSKAALRCISETLAVEIEPFSIRMLIVEPAAFRTNSLMNTAYYTGNMIQDYDEMREKSIKWYETVHGLVRGDPAKAMEVVTDVVRGEGGAAGRPWPLYLILGDLGVAGITEKCHRMLKVIDDWKDLTTGIDVDPST